MAQQKTTDLSKFNNQWLKKGAPSLIVLIWYIVKALYITNPLNLSSRLKVFILRMFGSKIGKNVMIKQGVNIKYPWKLVVGSNTWIGEKVWIDNLDRVVIGNNVCISQGAYLLTGNHNYKKESFDLIIGEINIENGVWIGAKAVVSPGITCKSHAILTINSVATKDLDAYSIYQGNPAKKIRERKIQ